MLSRNWWWNLLSSNVLQIVAWASYGVECAIPSSLHKSEDQVFVNAFQELVVESKFLFVMLNAFFDILFSVAQHAVEQPSQMVGHGQDRVWGAKSGRKRRYLAPSALLL